MVGNLDSGDYTIVSFSVFPEGKSNVLELQLITQTALEKDEV
jgi:hypothetical protein